VLFIGCVTADLCVRDHHNSWHIVLKLLKIIVGILMIFFFL
jgi:hypothetical protein